LAEQSTWYIYLLRCANGDLYTGISTDVARRLQQHVDNRGARRLRGKGPLQLVFSHPVGDRSQALRLECRVKRLSRLQKEALVRGERDLPSLEPVSQQG
jgi:putative endonuclease